MQRVADAVLVVRMRLDHLLVFGSLVYRFSTVSAESTFNFATTPGKLPKQVRPETYAIRIVPDLEKLHFYRLGNGEVDVQKPVTKLVLSALDLAITAASVDGKPLDTVSNQTRSKRGDPYARLDLQKFRRELMSCC